MAERVVDGWDVFERWAKRFRTHAALDVRYAYCLSTGSDLTNAFETNPPDLDLDEFECSRYSDQRIKHRIDFLRDYLVDISFDGGDFHATVKHLLKYQSPRMCPHGYTIWLDVNDYEAFKPPYTLHFNGVGATLFCEHFDDYHYGSVFGVAPFEKVFVRNKKGADWTKPEAAAFLKSLKSDIASDGVDITTSQYYVGGEYFWGPILAAWVKVKSPKNVYFDCRKRKQK